MFGLSFGELCVLIVVAIVVIGPKDMPKVLRKIGQLRGQDPQMAADVRAQSGIDDVLRTEGLTKELTEIRRLAQGDFLELPSAGTASAGTTRPGATSPSAGIVEAIVPDRQVVREREYPREGADGYGALPDTSAVYASSFPASPWASDPLYVTGDADGKLPEKPEAVDPPALVADGAVGSTPTSDVASNDAPSHDVTPGDPPAQGKPAQASGASHS